MEAPHNYWHLFRVILESNQTFGQELVVLQTKLSMFAKFSCMLGVDEEV